AHLRAGHRAASPARAATHRRAVHQPDHRLAGGAVAPEDVGKAVAVEVALADDRPRASHRTWRTASDHEGAIHLPEHHEPAAAVAPQDVALEVAVEVVGSSMADKHPRRPGKAVVMWPAHHLHV